MKSRVTKTAITSVAIASILACGTLALAGENDVAGTTDAQASAEAQTAGDITAESIREYCGTCHFSNIENASISSWNKTNVDLAMVESMTPMLDDETIQNIADYFAQIEPPAEAE